MTTAQLSQAINALTGENITPALIEFRLRQLGLERLLGEQHPAPTPADDAELITLRRAREVGQMYASGRTSTWERVPLAERRAAIALLVEAVEKHVIWRIR
jgi:hypothetical protein